MANEITFDKLPQTVGYLTEQVERIYKIVAALQPQTAIDKHRIVEIDEACKITRKAKPAIYTLARKGLIPAYKRGKKLYFYEDELLSYQCHLTMPKFTYWLHTKQKLNAGIECLNGMNISTSNSI